MATALAVLAMSGVPSYRRRHQRSLIHRIALGAVWLTVASSAIVFSEPAPVDALTIGLGILLPVIGLTKIKPWLGVGLALWFAIAACGYIGATQSLDIAESTTHISVSLYLYLACVLFAAFVAKAPEAHCKLILNAYLAATVLGAVAGIIGYFDIIPGSYDLFTRYDRATGTFKDPNVFGPFLIGGLLVAVHLWLIRPPPQGLLPLVAAALITLATLLTFSRGAWAAAAGAFALYAYLYLVTAQSNRERLKIVGLVIAGTAITGLILAAALQSEAAANLIEQRATLTQPYDEGPEGRFGGQQKAFHLILDNPLGIGAQAFTHFYHHEEAHNVYLTAMLNGGWIGGLIYLLLMALTLWLGWLHALKRTRTQKLFLIVYAAMAANILEGYIIDSDHWRHFYLLVGLAWGLMAGDTREVRCARIIRDCRPLLAASVLIVPPSRRNRRIIRLLRPQWPPVLPRAQNGLVRKRVVNRSPRILKRAIERY